MQRLGKNIGGYRGEPIDVERVLSTIADRADRTGWHRDFFSTPGGHELIAYRRISVAPRRRVYISAGIHGDEPAGPLAVSELLLQNRWPDTLDLWLCPCLNRAGFVLNRRENADGIDLNRDYRHGNAGEVQAHMAWLKKQPSFDVTLCLHEDWEAGGFYIYEVNPDGLPSLAEEIVREVSRICPVETANHVDGWEIQSGIIRPQRDPMQRAEWPETIFLILNKTRLGYTFEAPSDFPLQLRADALVMAVRAVLDRLGAPPIATAMPADPPDSRK